MSHELEELANDLTTGDLDYKPEKMDFLNKIAKSYGQEWEQAVDPTFIGSEVGRIFDTVQVSSLADQGVEEHYVYDRKYRGQNIEFHGNEKELNRLNKVYKVEDAPDLLGVFVGEKSPSEVGLKYSPNTPGKYPWGDNTKVYDSTPYVSFQGFEGSEESKFILNNMIEDLKPGSSISHKDMLNLGIDISHHTSVDFGERINWSIGKTDEGEPYLAMSDIWDFKGMGTKGNLMENYGKGEGVKNIGFYGRFKIKNEDGE
tara:strand:- start:939 stop:1712 length:774 start_codon:yes stop_codon:yes gene_type:complete